MSNESKGLSEEALIAHVQKLTEELQRSHPDLRRAVGTMADAMDATAGIKAQAQTAGMITSILFLYEDSRKLQEQVQQLSSLMIRLTALVTEIKNDSN